MTWLCKPCDAYVGCHNNTERPLGTLANKELRTARKETKAKFIEKFMQGDWKDKEGKQKGYQFLEDIFNREYHFGESSLEELDLIKNNL